jgi:hypothetical protein
MEIRLEGPEHDIETAEAFHKRYEMAEICLTPHDDP